MLLLLFHFVLSSLTTWQRHPASPLLLQFRWDEDVAPTRQAEHDLNRRRICDWKRLLRFDSTVTTQRGGLSFKTVDPGRKWKKVLSFGAYHTGSHLKELPPPVQPTQSSPTTTLDLHISSPLRKMLISSPTILSLLIRTLTAVRAEVRIHEIC